MKRTQFVVEGKHPLLLLVRDQLILSGFELVPIALVDDARPVFIIFGAEVYTAEESAKVCSVASELSKTNWPAMVLSSSSVYGDCEVSNKLYGPIASDEAQTTVVSTVIDSSAVRPITAMLIEHLFVVRKSAKTIVVRPFNVYGPDVKTGVIPTFIRAAVESATISVYAPGIQTRTFLHQEDFSRAILALVQKLLKGCRGIYNVGSTESVEVLSLAKSVKQLFNNDAKICVTAGPHRLLRWKLPNIDRIKEHTGWKPEISLRSGLFRIK